MNLVAVAVAAPVAVLVLFDPSILLWLIGFGAVVYLPTMWLQEKVIGEKPITGVDKSRK